MKKNRIRERIVWLVSIWTYKNFYQLFNFYIGFNIYFRFQIPKYFQLNLNHHNLISMNLCFMFIMLTMKRFIFFKEVLFTKKNELSNLIFYTIFLCVCYIYKTSFQACMMYSFLKKKSHKRFSALCYLIWITFKSVYQYII